ncbi:hypothetical protein NSQ77_19905 [Oceanobacillus sp. FSL K6-2867]|uniref:hypothetical protein n=1 Tax=Oceanobacillus sp. FSL K6-2867 TaxID=2954748 RepID=UPI0030DA1908
MANYINLSNSLLEVDSNNRLNVEELYLFSYLWTERTYENRVKTGINFLNEDVELLKDKKQNKKRVIGTLESLKEKQLINVEEKGKMLIVTFAPHKEEGYTGVPYNKVEKLNPTGFYIYVMVAKWNDGARYSYTKWAELLDCSESTAKRAIKKAVEAGIIYKLEGGFDNGWVSTGQLKQDINTYSVKPILTSVKEEKVKKETKSVKEVAPTYKEMEFAEYKVGNWFNKDKFADNKDYDEYLYRKAQAENGDKMAERFVKHCESRIEGWLNHKNENVRSIAKDKLEKAKDRFETGKSTKEQSNSMIDRYLAQLNGEINYERIASDNKDNDWIKEWAEAN